VRGERCFRAAQGVFRLRRGCTRPSRIPRFKGAGFLEAAAFGLRVADGFAPSWRMR